MNYLLLPKVEFRLRGFTTLVLFIVGIIAQWSSSNFFVGSPFILLAGLLHIQKGAKLKRPEGGKVVWRQGTLKELLRIEDQMQRIKKWRGLGFSAKSGIAIPIFFALVFVSPFFGKTAIFIWDLAILFAPIFFTGTKSAWEPPDLRTKATNMKDLINSFLWKSHPRYSHNLEFGIMRKVDSSYPFDVRLKICKEDQPEQLIGIQGQYSINRVKNREYPYFYIVIIAKHDFELKRKIGRIANWTAEFERDKEVDVCVVRQHTTKTSGYHTPLSTQLAILKSGIEIFERLNEG